MRKNEVQIGKTYAAKVTGKIVPVRLTGPNPYGGWTGQNLWTGREVRIRTAARLRHEILGPVPKPATPAEYAQRARRAFVAHERTGDALEACVRLARGETRCPDCGEWGERQGHQTCRTPRKPADEPDPREYDRCNADYRGETTADLTGDIG